MTAQDDRADAFVLQYLDARTQLCDVLMGDARGRDYVKESAARLSRRPETYTRVAGWAGRGDGRTESGRETAKMMASATTGAALVALAPRFEWLSRAPCPSAQPLLRRMQSLRNVIVEKTRRWIWTHVRRMRRKDLHEDMHQAGAIALLRGLDMFEPEKGGGWLTYITPWIRQGIDREYDDQSTTIRIPVHMRATARMVRRVETNFLSEHGRTPTEAEILSRKSSLKDYQVRSTRRMVRQGASLDAKLRNDTGDGGATIGDFIPADGDWSNPEKGIADRERITAITGTLTCLTAKERHVVIRRFGLDDRAEETLGQIGDRMGISRERVRQVQVRAQQKMLDRVPHGQKEGLAS